MADSIELKDFYTLKNIKEDNISKCINKIMNTLSFRKLAGKTQVILSLSGPNVRTRLTHTIEVAKIARDICNKLELNVDLAEAIALAHDIGHTPFGHVGERTLREVMCGCDTLKDQVTDCDFNNSGFKHNLQSFRVLHIFERLVYGEEEEESKEIWPYILWGAVAHSAMTWAKSKSGMDKEIYVSCEHCDKVFSCIFHEKQECKRNVHKKKKVISSKELVKQQKELCKPWYCATLQVVNIKEKARELIKDNKLTLKIDESIEEYIGKDFFHPDYLKYIYCRQKCYIAKLWEYKINENNSFLKYKFLYDHPFPNSFYLKDFYKFFYSDNEENIDWISIEAVIVSIADEIAQRQQDLEDGIQKNLISMKYAKEQIKDLVDLFFITSEKSKKEEEIDNTCNQEELGSFLVKFYIELLTKVTKENFRGFCNDKKREKINIYCLVNNIFSLKEYKENTITWISNELSCLISDKTHDLDGNPLKSYFAIDLSEEYFCFIVFYYLEDCFKLNGVAHYEMLNKFIEYLEVKQTYSVTHNQKETEHCLKNFNFLKELDAIWGFFKENFKDTYKDILNEKGNWKNINRLTLYQYYIFTELIQKNKDIIEDNTITVKKFIDNCKSIGDIEKDYNNSKFPEIYFKWRQQLGNDANQVLSHLVGFISEKDNRDVAKKKADKLESFEKNLKITILNSEVVEKNDGKASYILKRLFKAFIANSHQLPDEYLRSILFNLIDHYDDLLDEDEKCFKFIINKLDKTMPELSGNGNDITLKVLELNFSLIPNNDNNERDNYDAYKHELSNEIKAISGKRIDLYRFFVSIKDNKKLISHRKAIISESPELRKHLKLFRGILDNPILTANSLWKSILTRGICDYIASLTDQEAVNEYEKLYAGIMEIV